MIRESFRDYFDLDVREVPFSPIIATSNTLDGDMRRKSNRLKFLHNNRIPSREFLLMVTDHGGTVANIPDDISGGEINADSLIISGSTKINAVGVMTADCLPIELIDRKGMLVFVHAGWKELLSEVLTRSVLEVRNQTGCKPEELLVHFGPGICREDYQVGKEVSSLFARKYRGAITADGKKDLLSLAFIAREQLSHVGVPLGNITEDGRCTYEDESLFSRRRSIKAKGTDDGRFMTLVRF